MKKYITVEIDALPQALKAINESQTKQKTFYNVTVKPYKGRKHDGIENDKLLTIIIG